MIEKVNFYPNWINSMKKQIVALTIAFTALVFLTAGDCTPPPEPNATPSASTTPAVTTASNRHLQYGCARCYGAIIERQKYVVCHEPIMKVPLWVEYNLTPADLEGCVERVDAFKADPDLQPGLKAELTDYAGSGYDRGHMAPCDDMCSSREVMNQSFCLSNMVPQNGSLNSGKWRSLESKIQTYCRNKGAVWIITGPIFENTSSGTGEHPKIGLNQVWVPQKLYKIVLWPHAGNYTAFAFIVRNEKPPTAAQQTFKAFATASLTTIDEIESETGFDFFKDLPDNIEQGLEPKKATEQELSTFLN
jgi:endonuclease G